MIIDDEKRERILYAVDAMIALSANELYKAEDKGGVALSVAMDDHEEWCLLREEIERGRVN